MAPASHFALHTRAIGWALMQMQEGHGANYVGHIVQEGITQFTSWEDFQDSFAWEFHEVDVEVTASLTLESEAYNQHKCDIDLYVDSFQSLYQKVGYPDGHHLVMKFQCDLSKKLSDRLRNISTGHPDDTQAESWMTVACKQAFIIKTETNFAHSWSPVKTTKQAPTFASGQILKGHYKQDCPFCHDLHFMDNKEKDKLTMQLLAWQDMLAAKSQATASHDLDTYI
ncbi:hypothetical protein DXG03_007494 [Asterophora parasitica]|uniref:Uncharacterized protein n=1 Tax=Asterophora parasitica TaxID=117018 RepID=A0A9P7G557_9AGAR|nr:hypothetical protein DXG03_007494 [Asterophora parasitica]